MQSSLAGKRLRELRRAVGLNQDELGEKIGASYQQISRIERGESNPTPETLVALAQVFNVSADYLLGLSDEPNLLPETLTEEERALILLFRAQDDESRWRGMRVLRALWSESNDQKD
ncbi:MAG: helix-turn-helix transcriptional regulator [Chloroflexota bacterium]